jgi:DNA-directed RNA polymerase I, II, and III subunit RPABC2
MMTKYEKTRIIGTRATQIAMGAAPMVECTELSDPLRIAEKELKEFRVPLVIRRFLPDGSYEDWKVSEFNPNK